MTVGQWLRTLFLVIIALGLLPLAALAAPPVVKTVPWAASYPLIPHDTYEGKRITLKGTSDVPPPGNTYLYSWDFGDGSPVASGSVTSANNYALQALHTYTGSVGTTFTARLTVLNNTTGESSSKEYYVKIQNQELSVEVNIAIDEGLWYLHKGMTRTGAQGYWNSTYPSLTPANVTAFEVNGHLETGTDSNPYVETVQRAMKYTFASLKGKAVSNQANKYGGFSPDTNGNGIGIAVNTPYTSYENYMDGMFMDAIIASGTPAAVTTTGPANVIGRTYRDVVQDMADYYNFCQQDTGANAGGWQYTCNSGADNSFSQWAAIGYIPAERAAGWAIPIPPPVKAMNMDWLAYSQAASGSFGYQNSADIWGPYATTPSGMVQLVMNGVGRGNARWDKAETFMRDRFCSTGGATSAVRDYYYGLFSFSKSMLLHDSNNDKIAEPIKMLQSSTAGVLPLDWYAAEQSKGAPCDGVARTLVSDQMKTSDGNNGRWSGHLVTGEQDPYETTWAIIMLNQTIYEAGAPVAVATATPSPALANQLITLNGSSSFHQDATKSIVKWEWDLDNNGAYDVTGVTTTNSWPAIGTYPVRLRVTDNATPQVTAETTLTVQVTVPPIRPTANAGGPYSFCMNRTPWYVNGAASNNPDDGQSQPGYPGDFIKSYAWELTGDNLFNDATGVNPNVTAIFTTLGVGDYLIHLRVTDNTAASFPVSGLPDLSHTDTAQVFVKAATDPACASCVSNLSARPKSGKVGLTWAKKDTAVSYNVYRSTVSGGPYTRIGTATNTTLPAVAYLDTTVASNTTYFYIVREVALNGVEYCSSNQASTKTPL